MLKTTAVRSRVCASFARSAILPPQRRWTSEALKTSPQPLNLDVGLSSTKETEADKDDNKLEKAFNQSHFVRSRAWLARSGSGKNVGLFKNRYLTAPEGFQVFANKSMVTAKKLYTKIANASSVEDYKRIVRDLDRLSDVLCRVLDLCDFVHMTHPGGKWRDSASAAWAEVYDYMNFLNTRPDLDDQLNRALKMPEVTSSWSAEERAVAEGLKLDFEKSAVHLPQIHRQKFIELSQKISETGTKFVETMEPANRVVDLPLDKVDGLRAEIKITRGIGNAVRFVVGDGATRLAMRRLQLAEGRKRIYMASQTASPGSVELLEKMLAYRAELAQVTGFESYAHQHLKGRMMAKSPAAVTEFLMALHKTNSRVVRKEIHDLTEEKKAHLGVDEATLDPWDLTFYRQRLTFDKATRAGTFQGVHLRQYFTVGGVMKGLSKLFNRLYGIRFIIRQPEVGEAWHADVLRLDVVDEENHLIAVLYCDLCEREGKSPNPAHYTIRCSREITSDEVSGALHELADVPTVAAEHFKDAEEAANDGMDTTRGKHTDGALMQVPTIALVCSFQWSDRRSVATLVPRDVETLYHEMGHAIHSILARTRFQNVAGTRCATDLAEVPSTLMEHFAINKDVLGMWAYHVKGKRGLVPFDGLEERLQHLRRFDGLNTERQIVLAMLDQECHSAAALDPNFSSTKAFHDIQERLDVGCKDHPDTCWQGFFGHLHGYGSTYYSYLFDRVLAERIWKVVFKSGEGGATLSRENGEVLKEKLLKWGGSKDPWECMADVLQDDRLAKGDEEAMRIVGSWGLKG